MEKKSNSGLLVGILIGIIIMLVIFIGLFATGTVSFKSTTTTDNKQTSENEQNSENNDDTANNDSKADNDWVEYILSQHIVDAKVFNLEKTSVVTWDDLKELLPQMKKMKIIKTYYNSRGSMIDGVNLNISYDTSEVADDYQYKINISANNNYCEIYDVSGLDDKLLNILDNVKVREKNIELNKEDAETRYYFELEGCNSSIFDNYIK